MEEFAHRASHCDHTRLAALEEFVRSLPCSAAARRFARPASPRRRPAGTGFAAVLDGLIRNRGFDVHELPFTELSRSTSYGTVARLDAGPHRQYRQYRLRAMARSAGPAPCATCSRSPTSRTRTGSALTLTR